MHEATLTYLFRGEGEGRQVSLGLKQKSLRKFGLEKWNGYGGRVEEAETIPEGACREVHEEAVVTVRPEDLQLVAKISFFFPDLDPKKDWDQTVYVFCADVFEGEPDTTEEMIPRWFPVCKETIPWDKMWVSDRIWVWDTFLGKKFEGKIVFNGTGESVRFCDIAEVSDLSI